MRDDAEVLNGYDLVVDIAHPKGRAVLYPPCGLSPLRSEITFSMIQGSHPNPAIRVIGGFLPGMRIYMDTKKMACKIIDRLSLPEGEPIMDSLRELKLRNERYANVNIPQRIKDHDFGIPKSEFAIWMYWLKRLFDVNKVKVVKGSLPQTYYEIIEADPSKQIRVSDDPGLRPLSKGDNPFNVLTLADFEYELESTGGKK